MQRLVECSINSLIPWISAVVDVRLKIKSCEYA